MILRTKNNNKAKNTCKQEQILVELMTREQSDKNEVGLLKVRCDLLRFQSLKNENQP